ncbi:MAG TPA: helix-turn-helix domain-containing protein [Jatrophihabitans sp.]
MGTQCPSRSCPWSFAAAINRRGETHGVSSAGLLGSHDRRSSEAMATAVLKKGARITGSDRNKLASDLKKQYDKGKSIRELAESHGRSYGFVHRVLSESGTTLRGRGGATRTKSKRK